MTDITALKILNQQLSNIRYPIKEQKARITKHCCSISLSCWSMFFLRIRCEQSTHLKYLFTLDKMW